jgi:type I restriction enzyme M protein
VSLSDFPQKVSFIWSVADLLRGPYKPAQYGRVILPLTVLRRLDCVLEPTKAKVVEQQAEAHQLYDLQAKLAAEQVYHSNEIEEFAKVFFKPKGRQASNDHAQMHRILGLSC